MAEAPDQRQKVVYAFYVAQIRSEIRPRTEMILGPFASKGAAEPFVSQAQRLAAVYHEPEAEFATYEVCRKLVDANQPLLGKFNQHIDPTALRPGTPRPASPHPLGSIVSAMYMGPRGSTLELHVVVDAVQRPDSRWSITARASNRKERSYTVSPEGHSDFLLTYEESRKLMAWRGDVDVARADAHAEALSNDFRDDCARSLEFGPAPLGALF